MFGAPLSAFPVQYPSFSAVYNPKTLNPDVVHEHLEHEDLEGDVNRSHFSFKPDSQIPPMLQASLRDFRKQGYDRGHFAAAASHRSSRDAMQATFNLSNISPFDPSLNRGYWSRLEKHVRNLTKIYGSVDVDSGPVFAPPVIEINGERYEMQKVIGENNVKVPTHFFKVLSFENEWNEIETEAYLVPNKAISKKVPLEAFQTTVRKIEEVARLHFPQFDEEEEY